MTDKSLASIARDVSAERLAEQRELESLKQTNDLMLERLLAVSCFHLEFEKWLERYIETADRYSAPYPATVRFDPSTDLHHALMRESFRIRKDACQSVLARFKGEKPNGK